jgi:hypothetical protein
VVTPDPTDKPRQSALPGKLFKQLARRSWLCDCILSHTHVLQIVDDHQAMWLTADTPSAKKGVEKRLRKQLSLAMANVAGFETFVHGCMLTVVGDPLPGGLLLLAGLLIMRVTGKGG